MTEWICMQTRKVWIWLTAVLLLCLMPLMAGAEELRGYVKGQGWVFAQMGQYPYEKDGTVKPVLWRVLSIENDQALLITEYVIDTQQVIFESDPKKIEKYDYRRITCFEESDMFPWINTVMIDTMFGTDPIRNVLIPEDNGASLFILDNEEFLNPKYGFSATKWNNQPSRHATGTPYAIRKRGLIVGENGRSPYFSATIKSSEAYHLALVGYDGHISWAGYTRTNVGLRPCIRVDLTELEVTGGKGTREKPFVLSYTGSEGYTAPVTAGNQQQTAAARPTATPVPAPTAVPVSEGEVLLSFVGDCSIGDSIQYVDTSNSYHTVIDEKGYAWPFSLVKEYLAADDLTVANLEVVFTERRAHLDKMYPLVGAPDHVNVLLEGSVEMVNTVNNHCMDFHNTGYNDTLEVLDQAGIARFGTVYPGQENGHDDLGIQEIDGIRFGFIGFTYPQSSDQKKIANRIKTLKEEENCDIVIVSLHWGTEEEMLQNAGQINLAKAAINAGADLIWGHHPHVVQPIHFYKGKPVFYSTGNFTFGTMSQVDPSTGIFQVAYERIDGEVQLKRLQVIPCKTQGSGDYRPYVLTDEKERQEVFANLYRKRAIAKCVNPPESFLKTGVVYFENGEIVP